MFLFFEFRITIILKLDSKFNKRKCIILVNNKLNCKNLRVERVSF